MSKPKYRIKKTVNLLGYPVFQVQERFLSIFWFTVETQYNTFGEAREIKEIYEKYDTNKKIKPEYIYTEDYEDAQ